VLPGFRFVISFDGLHDALSEDDFTDLLGSHDPVEMIASRSLDRAVRAGSSDDISTI
jgi:serine/threonine protein phosphatase PrpC